MAENQTQVQEVKVPAWYYSVDPSGFYSGWFVAYGPLPERVVLLNAMVPANEMMAAMMKTDLQNAVNIIKQAKEVVSYIGHKSTAELLARLSGREIPVNRGEYVPQSGDLAIVVRLTKRLQSPGDVEVKPEDLEFWLIRYHTW